MLLSPDELISRMPTALTPGAVPILEIVNCTGLSSSAETVNAPYPAIADVTIAKATALLFACFWMLMIRLLCMCFALCFDYETHRNDFAVSGSADIEVYRTDNFTELSEFNVCSDPNEQSIAC